MSKTIGEQVYLEFDIEAQLLETDDKTKEQLRKMSDIVFKHSNGSRTDQNIYELKWDTNRIGK